VGDNDEILDARGGRLWKVLAVAAVATACAEAGHAVPWRMGYTLAGVLLLTAAALWASTARQVAITATSAAFFIDLLGPRVAWAVVPAIGVAWATERWRAAGQLYTLLLWTALVDGLIKACVPWPADPRQKLTVQAALLALGVGAQLLLRRGTTRDRLT
jgi:FtsH-binding integral membrane protein